MYGSRISYYAGKLETYLRYRGIDYELLSMIDHAREIREGAGAVQSPILRLEDGAWQRAGTLPAQDAFGVVGADFGPDNLLYILERAFSPLGFRSRIRRLSLDGETPQPETLLTTRLGDFDNLEGIDVWRDPAGSTRITLVSDDNFLRVQRSELVEFVLQE